MSDRDAGSSFLIGFILGAIAGVAVGFLYAPKAGKETRALIREKINEMRGKASDLTADAEKKVRDKLGQ